MNSKSKKEKPSKGIVAVSLLSANFLNLKEDLDIFNEMNDLWYHIDVMDGHYVPNLTFGHPLIKQIASVAKRPLDVHLMVDNPEFYVETLKNFNVHNLTVHYEALTHHHRTIQEIKNNYKSVGISLNPGTSLSMIPEFILKEIDLVLLMTVNPGFGGQKFIDGVKDKIKELNAIKKKLKLNFQIQVDGGVNDKNKDELISLGVNNLVAGSYVFNKGPKKYLEQISKLR